VTGLHTKRIDEMVKDKDAEIIDGLTGGSRL
jgi:hypothetical protein